MVGGGREKGDPRCDLGERRLKSGDRSGERQEERTDISFSETKAPRGEKVI